MWKFVMRFNDLLKCLLNCDVANALKKNKSKKKRKLVLQNSRVKLAQKDIFEKYRKTVYVSVRRYPRTHNSLQIDKYYINQS